jgi:hypothetical protein
MLAPGICILAYRLRVLRIMLTAGIPLSKLENTPAFRQLLEVDHFALTLANIRASVSRRFSSVSQVYPGYT